MTDRIVIRKSTYRGTEGYTVTVCAGRGPLYNPRVFVTTMLAADRCRQRFMSGETITLEDMLPSLQIVGA